ncbi:oxygen-insensitive NAD(P)H nitroreductase [Aquipluma nitroreducens]|uniref:Oxygen-insensitive NAD(P)H nitroreductase n=1 Tax=Aquipluma nitroreducens TaxID=2010828 RepID=A0A5K7S7D9_9BACT|nr:NAD(P)H-dependent oxidoreductase [Aquipluma nitroreducens]BBE17488.1 oxygen-insensitive NAD(P)H nitroreductase [Aquipluma nitroreducens]
MSALNNLEWRYAAKRMNGQKVPAEKLEKILKAIQLAPTSIGLQPFTVLVVENEELKAKMAPAIYNQPQITEGSHVLVFAAWKEYSDENVEKYLNNIATVRGIPVESLDGMRNMINGAISGKTPEQLLNWNSRQAYIALGTGLAVAAEEQVDSTPMEGFDPDALDAVLGLQEKGLRSTVILALGYRDAEKDYLSSSAKVRRNKEELFVRL